MQSERGKTIGLWALLLWLPISSLAKSGGSAWPEWDEFADRFVQGDGRVIDLTFDGKSTSEGQSYGLFFALVANDRDRFDRILRWTSDNLADGQLGRQLPGWHWGKRDDGSWGIKDRNSASDADLWLAYTLLEAARLWERAEYETQGRALLALVERHEVARVGRRQTLLLPGAVGFKLSGDRYRVNPSYLPPFQFKYFAAVDPSGPWADIWRTHEDLAPQIYAAGVAPDNVVVDGKGRVAQDTERAPSGSYDAIRVYMWAGMSGDEGIALRRRLGKFVEATRTLGGPPENVDPATGAVVKADYMPMGHVGAMLPFLDSLGEKELLKRQQNRLRVHALAARVGRATNYYDQALILFGSGWLDGYYRFDGRGGIQPRWSGTRR
jgi:endoglucanase